MLSDMKHVLSLITFLMISLSLTAGERELLWPKNKMPHRQDHQIAAMTDESKSEGFNPDKHRIAYI